MASKSSKEDKLLRKHIREQQKRLKPGDCLKYLKLYIGSNVFTEIGESGKENVLFEKLTDANIRYDLSTEFGNLLFWKRSDQQTLIANENSVELTEKFTKEAHIILIVNAQSFLLAPQSIVGEIKELRSTWPQEPFITVGIFGLKDISTKPSALELEMKITELQILHNINVRLLNRLTDFVDMVVQFSKAVSEIPFKKQEASKFKMSSGSCGFLLNDNKDCVKVEENNAGMSRLWQQHLTRLPLVTLEVAETIIAEFPNPKALLDFINKSSETEFINFVSELRVKRSALGNLDNARRLGRELAKKLLTLYGSLNPEEYL